MTGSESLLITMLEGVAIIILGAGVLGIFRLANNVSRFESQMQTWTKITEQRMNDHETRIRTMERSCPSIHTVHEGAQS